MAKKNPFKKQSIMDTLVNVGIGGAANVAIDAAVTSYNKTAGTPIDETYVHVGKIALGVVGGSMVDNRYLRAAMDGVSTVGVSNLIASFMQEEPPAPPAPGTSGFMASSVGAMRTGKPMYAAKAKKSVSGTADLVG